LGLLGNGVLLLVFEHGAKIGVYFHRCIHICPFVYGHDVQSFTLGGKDRKLQITLCKLADDAGVGFVMVEITAGMS
jgi:hypothetical protein